MGAFDGFLKNFRDAITNGAGGAVAQGTKQLANTNRKEPQKVWGFEEDKSSYGNERDSSKLTWRRMEVMNNDTGETFEMSVGYDKDGRISGVQKFTDPTHSVGHYGQENIGDFFKKNFDRDATDYTIFGKPEGTEDMEDTKLVLFDTKHDGAFVPSTALNYHKGLRAYPAAPKQKPDKPEVTFRDQMDKIDNMDASFNGMRYVQDDEQKIEAADRGTVYDTEFRPHLDNPNDLSFFTQNANDFSGLVNEFSRTPDHTSRMKLLEEAYKKYGSNPQFGSYLNIMAMDEQAHQNGEYEDYDYRQVGKNVNDAINSVFKHYYHYA